MWGDKLIYLEVTHRDFRWNSDKRGNLYESLVIEDYISSERTFEFIHYENDVDIFKLEQYDLFPLIRDIKEMEIYHEELSIKKGHGSLTLEELVRMRRFFSKIAEDPFFQWNEFIVV